MPPKLSLPLLVAVIMVGGCVPYEDPFAFEPHPADVTAARPGADVEPVRTLVSILGVHRPDARDPGKPPAIEVRLRVENTSPFPVTFDPGSLVLFSGGLARFPDPIVAPGEPVDVATGGSVVVDASFPFPGDGTPDGTDMSGLNLRWTLVIDGQPVTSSATFARQPSDWDYAQRGIGVGYQRYP